MNKLQTTWHGITYKSVERLSQLHCEPDWLRKLRLTALRFYNNSTTPDGCHLLQKKLDEQLCVYACCQEKSPDTLNPKNQAAGLSMQIESQVVVQHLLEYWRSQGVLFCDLHTGIRQYPDLVRKYLTTVIEVTNNKYAALNSALWSGGMLVYIPAHVHITEPLHLRYLIGQEHFGQFERTLVIAKPHSQVHIVEGCSSPPQIQAIVHAGVVEIVAHENARVDHTSIQNWSQHVLHVANKRAHVYANAHVSWTSINAGSHQSFAKPTSVLLGASAYSQSASLVLARNGQHQHVGAHMIHRAAKTKSLITSRAIVGTHGNIDAQAHVCVEQEAHNAQAHAACHTLLVGINAQTISTPKLEVHVADAQITHEASISAYAHEQMVYLMSRGFNTDQAQILATVGFVDEISQRIPPEYAVEIEQLIAQLFAPDNNQTF